MWVPRNFGGDGEVREVLHGQLAITYKHSTVVKGTVLQTMVINTNPASF